MKLIEIKCPSCGGKVTIEHTDSELYTCQYCGNQFVIQKDKSEQNITNNYTIYQNSKQEKKPSNPAGFIVGLTFVFLFTMVLASVMSMERNTVSPLPANFTPVQKYRDIPSAAVEKSEVLTCSPLYQSMVEKIFEKPLSNISQSELERIKYLKVSNSLEQSTVQYSFDDPYATASPLIQTISFPRMEWDVPDVTNLPGLTKLDLGYQLQENTDLSKLTNLKGLVCETLEFADIANIVAEPANILELDVKSVTSLDGVIPFKNLEQLSLKNVSHKSLKPLTSLKKLKMLSVTDTTSSDSIIESERNKARITDYTPISVMSSLESLHLYSDNIKSIDFVKDLPALTSLSLEHTNVFTLEPLTGKNTLTVLSLVDNYEMADFQSIGTLSGLNELTLEKSTSQPDPDLSALSQLVRLNISGFMSLSSIGNLSNIKELSIHGCNLDEVNVLSKLSNVERLTLYSVWTSTSNLRNLDFITGMTGLKYADFSGIPDGIGFTGFDNQLEVYGDVSPVFNCPNLEELYLDNGRFEINFDRIKENPSLKVLGLRNLTLHKNYHVESQGGFTNVWFDDVVLAEHLDFLHKFPNVEELYLDSNSLTDISFVTGLPMLSRLSIKDNYVTELSPLAQSKHLTYLNVVDNPLSTVETMGERVEIIQ